MTVNVADDCPAGTSTDEATVAAELLELKLTMAPEDGASPFSVTVPVECPPPRTDVGLRAIDATLAGLMVRVADWEVPAKDAVMVTAV